MNQIGPSANHGRYGAIAIPTLLPPHPSDLSGSFTLETSQKSEDNPQGRKTIMAQIQNPLMTFCKPGKGQAHLKPCSQQC